MPRQLAVHGRLTPLGRQVLADWEAQIREYIRAGYAPADVGQLLQSALDNTIRKEVNQ